MPTRTKCSINGWRQPVLIVFFQTSKSPTVAPSLWLIKITVIEKYFLYKKEITVNIKAHGTGKESGSAGRRTARGIFIRRVTTGHGLARGALQ